MIVQGQDHPNTSTYTANLASTIWSQDQYEEAEKLELQTMVTGRRVLMENHPNTLLRMSNLATTL